MGEVKEKLGVRAFRVMRLRVACGLRQKQIGYRMGISQQAVEKHLSRIRRLYPDFPRLITTGRHRRSAA